MVAKFNRMDHTCRHFFFFIIFVSAVEGEGGEYIFDGIVGSTDSRNGKVRERKCSNPVTETIPRRR